MRKRASISPKCENCRMVKRKGVLKIICSTNKKHKQTQG